MESIAIKYVRGKISKEDYLSACLDELDLSEQCQGIDGCEEFIKGKLKDAFWELDNLNRSDQFWEQTNKLPTFHKLGDFANYQIKNNKNIVNAAWLKIVSALTIVSQHLDIEAWNILKENNILDIEFLVKTAWSVSAYWNDQNIGSLTKLVKELKLEESIENELNKLALQSEEAKQWVSHVKSKINMV